MNSLITLDKNNLSSFLENYVDTGVKALDSMDLFKDDGLVASIPYGKLVGYFTKKLIEIKDSNEALKRLISSCHVLCLVEGIKKHNLSPQVNQEIFNQKITQSKQQLENYQVDATHFDFDNFLDNDIVKFYSEQIDGVFNDSFEIIERTKLQNFRNDYLKIYFFKILENQQTVFATLSSIFKSKSYEETLKLSKKEQYRNDLKNLFNEVVLNDEKGMTLSDVYVEPSFRVFNECLVGKQEHRGDSFLNVSDESIHNFIYRHLETNLPNDIYLCENPNLFFILGYPGQGKSSFCKKLLNDAYSQKKPLNKEIHFIKFRAITNSANLINDPLQTLYEYWKEDSSFTKSEKSEFKDSILILDGLDELFMKDNLPNDSINEFCRILIHQLENSDFPKVIITSRIGYVDTRRLKSSKTLIIQIKEFDLKRQIKWLNGYQVFHPETTMSIEKLTNYNNDITFRSIKELITQPILLHMIVTLNQEVTIDMDRAMIYNNIFDNLIDRKWEKEGQIEILKGINKEDLRNFLRDIAFAIFVSGYEYIHKSTLIKLPETQEFISKLDNKNSVQDVLKNIMVAFYFQEIKKNIEDIDTEDKSDYAIEFLHKSLQEYLVAEKIWEELLQFVEKFQRKDNFVIDNAKTALKHLTKIFQGGFLTSEIRAALSEVIKHKELSIRELLSNRFEKFLPEWFKYGFVIQHNWGEQRSVDEREMEIFTSFWFVLSQLIEGKDYFGSLNNPYLFDFLSRRINPEYIRISNLINWSNQTIKGDIEASMVHLDKAFQYQSINRFIVFNPFYNKLLIKNLTLSNLGFRNGLIYLDRSDSININECVFSEGSLTLSNKILQRVYNCNFRSTNISFESCSFEKCKFIQCRVTVSKIINMNNVLLTDCIFEECTLYIPEGVDRTFFNNNIMFQNCAVIITKSVEREIGEEVSYYEPDEELK
jgi:hypothetical protein